MADYLKVFNSSCPVSLPDDANQYNNELRGVTEYIESRGYEIFVVFIERDTTANKCKILQIITESTYLGVLSYYFDIPGDIIKTRMDIYDSTIQRICNRKRSELSNIRNPDSSAYKIFGYEKHNKISMYNAMQHIELNKLLTPGSLTVYDKTKNKLRDMLQKFNSGDESASSGLRDIDTDLLMVLLSKCPDLQ